MSLHTSQKKRASRLRALIQKYGPYCMRCDPEKVTPLRGYFLVKGGHREPLLTIDHVVPVRAGGSDDVANLQLLCMACHREVDSPKKGGHLDSKDDYRPKPAEGMADCPEKRAILRHPLQEETP